MLDDCHQNFFFQIVHGSYLGFVGRLALGAWRVASVVGFHWWMPSPSSGFTERPIVQVELKKEIKPL